MLIDWVFIMTGAYGSARPTVSGIKPARSRHDVLEYCRAEIIRQAGSPDWSIEFFYCEPNVMRKQP
jgi:hypothetical protein